MIAKSNLPAFPDSIYSMSIYKKIDWLSAHLGRITVLTVLNTKRDDIEILQMLLKLVRRALRNHRPFRVSRTEFGKNMLESRLRGEVHDWPDKFCFHTNALSEYHSIHLGEMVRIIIGRLKACGVNATVEVKHPIVQ